MIGLHNKYKDDYEHVPEVDKKGRFHDRFYYAGDVYRLPFDGQTKKKTYLPCIGLGVMTVLILIGQGLINQPSSRTVWVVLPYLLQFLPALFFFTGLAEYMMASVGMKRSEYEKGVQRMRNCAIGLIATAAASALADLVYIIMGFAKGGMDTGFTRELIYFIWHAATICAALMFGKYYNRTFSGIIPEKNN